MDEKAFLSWSGGKDSAIALSAARQAGLDVRLLVTTVSAATDRVSMHGVRRALVEAQAAALGLPLRIVDLPERPGMQAYEEKMRQAHRELAAEGFTQAVFGDIFLEDLKAYREELLLEDGLGCAFPLWQKSTGDLLRQFLAEGYKAVVVCTNASVLNKDFCGRELDAAFLAGLPPGVDPCGENGEYHSFVYDGPGFAAPVPFQKAAVVYKEYAAPGGLVKTDACFSTPRPASGFYFQDLLPAQEA